MINKCINCQEIIKDNYPNINEHNKKIYCDKCADLFYRLSKDDEYKEHKIEQALKEIQERKARLRRLIKEADEEARRVLS